MHHRIIMIRDMNTTGKRIFLPSHEIKLLDNPYGSTTQIHCLLFLLYARGK
jgi:hypothetical protein